jgi:predicted ATPase
VIRSVSLERAGIDLAGYPFSIPAIAALTTLDLEPGVTLFAGENGSGKSTLVEAIAVAAGFNAEGGSRNFMLTTRASHSSLHDHLHLVRDARPHRNGFFLRAESFYNVATYVEGLGAEIMEAYGGRSLHNQSHGESFLSLVLNRFKGKGLYILDEPEAALSLRGQLALIRRIHELVEDGSQFIVSTHSPILLAFPGARIYVLSEEGIVETPYDETEPVELTRAFLADPGRFLHYLFND